MKSRETLIRMQRFLVDEKRRDVAQIDAMIADFDRKRVELDQQIESEQEQSGITDVTHFAYPTFAKAAVQRRDNLGASIDGLKIQLEDARSALADTLGELKRLELLDEREERTRRSDMAKTEQRELDEVAASAHRS